MEKYIRYKRIKREVVLEEDVQEFFDELIAGGWEIIYYDESAISKSYVDENTNTMINKHIIEIAVVVGKKQENVL